MDKPMTMLASGFDYDAVADHPALFTAQKAYPDILKVLPGWAEHRVSEPFQQPQPQPQPQPWLPKPHTPSRLASSGPKKSSCWSST
jgi:hypothetical protein